MGGWIAGVVIKITSCLAFGMDQQPPTADFSADLGGAADDIQQQGSAQPPALMALVDAKAGEKGDGLGIAPGPFPQPQRSLFWADAGHTPAVVGDNVVTIGFCDDKDPARAAAGIGLAGVVDQPAGLLVGAASKGVELVCRG